MLAELRKCGLTDNENCLKTVTLSLNGGDTVSEAPAGGWEGLGQAVPRWGVRLAPPLADRSPASSRQTVQIQANGGVFVNSIYSQLPMSVGTWPWGAL